MCLENSNLNMSYSKKEGCFTGFGFKKLDISIPKNIRNKSEKTILKWLNTQYGVSSHLKGGWMEATGTRSGKTFNRDIREQDCEYGRYWPGFHIFLKEDDADVYYSGFGIVVKVEYAEVTDFGFNETDNSIGEGPCVVARYMRIVEIVSEEDEEDDEEEDYGDY